MCRNLPGKFPSKGSFTLAKAKSAAKTQHANKALSTLTLKIRIGPIGEAPSKKAKSRTTTFSLAFLQQNSPM